MTIILFLVDTSSSMCQKAYVNGVQKTYLDIAKGAVETFLKFRQRSQDCLGDRYMLLTFEEPPANVKAGWKENHATFMNELKNLQSTGLTPMNESLKNAFDLLNLNRMQSGIDTYGQGRCPFYLEPSVIIVITDGGRYSYRNGVQQEIVLPLNTQIPGSKFTKEPFRWDQRMFTLVLRMPGNKIDERAEGKVPHDDSPIERMCEVTGGRSYRVRSHFVLNQCIESLVQKIQAGVVLQFEPMLPKDGVINEALQDIVFQPMKKMIFVQKLVNQKSFPIGYWPLPEPYWPDPKAMTLPARDAHPKLKVVTPGVDEPQIVRNFPIDKYEVEASPLTLQILHKREPNKCWQVIISNGMHGFELPFGYLKANQNFTQVHLYVLAYNYPALLPLLHDLTHKHNMSPPTDLLYKFNSYVRSIPPYYCPFLRKALHSINVPFQLLQFLLPENADNYLSATVANQLKLIKNTAKQDQENLCMKVYKQLKHPKPPYRPIETAKLHTGVPLRRDLVRHPLLRETFAKFHAEIEPIEAYNFVVPQIMRQPSAKSYRNPFDIPRRDLIDEIARMREAFLRPTCSSFVAKDSGHCLPIAEMGNYQEYLKNKENPLREIEPTNVRQHMFGNPYKKDKHMVMVDEADLSDVTPMKSNNMARPAGSGSSSPINELTGMHMPKKAEPPRDRSRKVGPISKDFMFRRLSTDSRPSSPYPSSTAAVTTSSSSSSVISDFVEDSSNSAMSVSSDMMSDDGDNDRLVVAFDFNEDEPAEPEFPAINGYVRNFINGSDESSCDEEINLPTYGMPAASTSTTATEASIMANLPTNNGLNLMQQTVMLPQQQSFSNYANSGLTDGMLPVTAMYNNNIATAAAATTYAMPTLMAQTQTQQFNGASFQALQATATTTTNTTTAQAVQVAAVAAVAMPTTNYYHHNDINDAQEISRILQQCHNGSSSITSPTTTTSTIDCSAVVTKMDATTALMPPPATVGALSNNFDSLKRETQLTSSSTHNSNSNHINCNSLGATKTALSQPPQQQQALTEDQKEHARKHNLDIRIRVFRDIRRPGRNYAQLLENLNLIKGDYDMKFNFVQMCITESMRFRRKQMVNSIQEWWDRNKSLQLQS